MLLARLGYLLDLWKKGVRLWYIPSHISGLMKIDWNCHWVCHIIMGLFIFRLLSGFFHSKALSMGDGNALSVCVCLFCEHFKLIPRDELLLHHETVRYCRTYSVKIANFPTKTMFLIQLNHNSFVSPENGVGETLFETYTQQQHIHSHSLLNFHFTVCCSGTGCGVTDTLIIFFSRKRENQPPHLKKTREL